MKKIYSAKITEYRKGKVKLTDSNKGGYIVQYFMNKHYVIYVQLLSS